MDTIYCYEGTNVLKNKLGIKDFDKLQEAERKLSAIRVLEIQSQCPIGNFDLSHLCAIHKYIFQDIYEWAGEIRKLEISKGDWFCPHMQIPAYAESIFSELKAINYLADLSYDNFIKKLSSVFGDINALHPFREGNGRTQREFIRQLITHAGYSIDYSKTSQEEMIEASIASFRGDNSLLENLFSKCIDPHHGNKQQI